MDLQANGSQSQDQSLIMINKYSRDEAAPLMKQKVVVVVVVETVHDEKGEEDIL